MLRIIHAGYTVADMAARNPPGDFSCNGVRATDTARIIGAAGVKVFDRGQRATSIQFTLAGQKASLREAQRWALGTLDLLPAEGLMEIVCGSPGSTESVFFEGAVLASATPRLFGVRPIIALSYLAGKSSLTLDGDNGGNPEEGSSMRGTAAIPDTAESVAVVFPVPFTSAPVVTGLTIQRPAGGDGVLVDGLSAVSATGFTADLSAPIIGAGYVLHWSAQLPS